jgi:putative RNA 2'-phosphotransferase
MMNYSRLSKEVSYALRHAPWEYELELDEEGWVDIRQLLSSLHECNEWKNLGEQDLYLMIERSDKIRHEILGGKIRALYGHSIPQKIVKQKESPPEILYHGTARRFIPAIKVEGLKPQSRQYVHLSEDSETALQVGKRRDDKPILLKIKSLAAWNEGIMFYHGNEKVWLADLIPSEFIEF